MAEKLFGFRFEDGSLGFHGYPSKRGLSTVFRLLQHFDALPQFCQPAEELRLNARLEWLTIGWMTVGCGFYRFGAGGQSSPNRFRQQSDDLIVEIKSDPNCAHFIRNEEFNVDTSTLLQELRKEFEAFLIKSAEFSGCELYAEMKRRAKNPDAVSPSIVRIG